MSSGRVGEPMLLAHPGIVMRKGDGERNPWPQRHTDEHVPALRAWLDELGAR